jgi:hypothetical protein
MPGVTTRLRVFAPAVFAAALLASACSAPANDGTGGPGSADESAVPAAGAGEMSTDTRYPELYREMRLPEAPDAQVMSTGRQETSLSDGLSIRVSTPMAVQEARDYFSGALEGDGWKVTASRPLPGINVSNLTATKGPVTYTATFTSNSGATQIDINVVQN